MPTIKISELRPTGHDLFEDSENYLYELTDSEMMVLGGGRWRSTASIEINISIFAATLVTVNTNSVNSNTVGNGYSIVR